MRPACWYCGAPSFGRDHIIPRSIGGPDAKWNLIPACRRCNSAKADMWFEAYTSRAVLPEQCQLRGFDTTQDFIDMMAARGLAPTRKRSRKRSAVKAEHVRTRPTPAEIAAAQLGTEAWEGELGGWRSHMEQERRIRNRWKTKP